MGFDQSLKMYGRLLDLKIGRDCEISKALDVIITTYELDAGYIIPYISYNTRGSSSRSCIR